MSSVLPEHPFAFVAELMSTFPHPWFLCGGWAVDAWLGRRTRAHGDVDIAVFNEDHEALYQHLRGWHLIAHDADLRSGIFTEQWDGSPLALPGHIHARPPGEENAELLMRWVTPPFRAANDGFDFDLVFNERASDELVLQREPRVSLAHDRAQRTSATGVPIAAPEFLMFFKATAYPDDPRFPRAVDREDFLELLPLLDHEAREWLGGAIRAVVPEHAWLADL